MGVVPDYLLSKEALPDLYILENDKDKALKEIINALNIELYKRIKKSGLPKVKATIIQLFDEALKYQDEGGLDHLPETIELLFREYAKRTELLIKLSEISNDDNSLGEHSINVMFFVMNYCIHCDYTESDVRRLSLGALLHDIGKIKLPDHILNADHYLSNDEFEIYKSHTILGHAILKKNDVFDDSIARIALEHHENIDGSGYPKGMRNISFEGQLINIVNCFEQLTYKEKKYRKVRRPFDAMYLIKNEVLEKGKFSKEIFKNFCKSLSP